MSAIAVPDSTPDTSPVKIMNHWKLILDNPVNEESTIKAGI